MRYPEQESSLLEFKRELPKNEQIIKTIVGFCNQKGGRLVVGIDNNGTIIGLKEELIQSTLEYLNKSIFEATTPPIIPKIYSQRIGNKSILIIEVSAGMNKPYFISSQGLEKGTYVRLGRSTLRATIDIIEELKWQARGRSFDSMPVYQTTRNDLDMKKIQTFLAARKKTRNISISDEILAAYNIECEEHSHLYPTVSGILCFGKKPEKFFSEVMIMCSLFSGIKGRKALASKDCVGTLPEQFSQAYDFVIQHLQRSFEIRGKRRYEQLAIPEEAIREIIMNAVVHRNYHLQSPIKIAIYENRVEIFSPGNFVGPMNVENITQGLTYIRNNAICKIFRELGYIEKLGSGFITVFDAYEKRGLPQPKVIEGENYIKCILPRPQKDTRFLMQDESLRDDSEQCIIRLFERGGDDISISDITTLCRISRATAGRKLADLIDKKIIKRIGKGRATRYRKN